MAEMSLVVKRHRCTHSVSCVCLKGHITDDAIYLVFRHLEWNPQMIAIFASVCRWFDELAKRVLWKEFCHARAPKMMKDLHSDGSHIVDGNWKALGKLLIYCSGCPRADGDLFSNIYDPIPGHFVYKTRFSKTLGRSLLPPHCRSSDVLYVSESCEHLDQGEEGDLGLFRGIIKSFAASNMKKMLIERQANFHPNEVCPYCKTKLWDLMQPNMIPRSAATKLGADFGSIEYYVCLNGHILGSCTLTPISDSEDSNQE